MEGSVSLEQEWLGNLIQHLSPRFGEFASDILSQQIEPLVEKVFQNSNMPDAKFKFTKTDMGNVPPKLDNISCHKDESMIILDFDLVYDGNCDLQVGLLGMTCGVQNLKIWGKSRLILKPTTKKLPFVGGLQFCFLETPNFDYDLDGIAGIIEWSPIKRKITKELNEDINKKCVFPNYFKMPLSDEVDIEQVKSVEPKMLLIVDLLSAEDLPKKGGLRSLVGQDKPDPYAKISLGAYSFLSEVVKNEDNPVWIDQRKVIWLDTIKGHNLKINLYDEDSFSRDDFLGTISCSLEDLPTNEVIVETLDLQDDEKENDSKDPTEVSGSITFQLELLPLVSEILENPRFHILGIFIYSFNNVMEDITSGSYPNTQVLVQAGDQSMTSQVKTSTPHPRFEDSFVLLLDSSEDIIIKILDFDNAGLEYGSFQLQVDELMENPIKRKIQQVNEDNPVITVTYSANIKSC